MTTKTKLPKLNLKTLKTIYLYADGHAVCVHREEHAKAGSVEWVDLYEKLGPVCSYGKYGDEDRNKGRIIFSGFYDFSPGVAHLLMKAEHVRVTKPTLEAGSDNTRRHGFAVGHLEIKGKDFSLDFNEIPGLISGEYTFQPDKNETWDDVKDRWRWADYRINKRYDASGAEYQISYSKEISV